MQNRPVQQPKERVRLRDQVREVFCCGDGPDYTGAQFRQMQRPQSAMSTRRPFGLRGSARRHPANIAYPVQPSMSTSQQPFAINTSRTRTFSPPNSLAGQLPAQTSDGTLRSAAQHTRPISLPAVPAPLQMRSDSRRATINAPFPGGQNGLVQGASRPAASLASTTLPQSSRRASVMDSVPPPAAQDVMARSVVTVGQPVASRRQSAMYDLANTGNRLAPSTESSIQTNSTIRQQPLINGQTVKIAQTGMKQPSLSKLPRAATSSSTASSAGTAARSNDYSGESSGLAPIHASRHPTNPTLQSASTHSQHPSRLTGGNHLRPVRSPPNQAGLALNSEAGDLRTNHGSQATGHGQGQPSNHNDPGLNAGGRRLRL